MYKLSSRLVFLLKCGFFVLVATGFLKIVLLKSQSEEKWDYALDTFDMFSENSTDSYGDERFTLEILREEFETCLMTPINEIIVENPSAETGKPDEEPEIKNSYQLQSRKIVPRPPWSDLVLARFLNLLDSLNIKAALIEPSILYCMLLPTYRELLVKRSLNISRFMGSRGIITFGILQQDVFILEEEGNIHNFRKNGFRSRFVRRTPTDWMINTTPVLEFTNFTSHIFYTKEDCTFHLVVFHNRENYLWHAALDRDEKLKSSSKNELLFVDSSGAYEKFNFVLLTTKVQPFTYFYIPSNPLHFLFQMVSSRFLECNTARSANRTEDNSHPKSHPGLSVERFNKRTVTVIRQLKLIFQPLLINLWIWSGTMLGWYRQCDIIPYTTDVDFAAWASEVEDLNELINKLRLNKYISIKMRMGLLEEGLEFQLDCYKLRTDVFFLYPLQNGSWCSGHSPKEGYYFRYHYPPFTLCSADLLGEKIQVPCETDKVITTEYGLQWFKPMSSWNYESSPRNRGPNIFWSKNKLKDAYQVY